jgi:hypothetical protein
VRSEKLALLNTSKSSLQAHAFRRFESYIRAEGMSELQAGRYVADHFYGDERDERKNASSTDLQWHRYRARALIVGYRYFLANGNIFDRQEGSLPGQVARL